jgi:hypothetical protein
MLLHAFAVHWHQVLELEWLRGVPSHQLKMIGVLLAHQTFPLVHFPNDEVHIPDIYIQLLLANPFSDGLHNLQ